MKNHDPLLPNSSQQARSKPRKRKNRLKNYQKVVEMIFLPPQTILEWLRHPMVLLETPQECFFRFFHVFS